MYGLTDSHETRKTNDPECHNTATYKASDDEKPKYVNLFLPREWECDLSFRNTTQLETIFRNKGPLTRKQMDHWLTNIGLTECVTALLPFRYPS